VSWRKDPQAMATDAFSLNWKNKGNYLFPPPPLVSRCLEKLRIDQAKAILITPVWPQRLWYPLLLQMSCQQPLLLPQQQGLLIEPHTGKPPTFNLTPIAAWLVSGDTTEVLAYQEQLQRYSLGQLDKEHPSNIISNGENLLAGAINGKPIRFHAL